MLFDGEGALSAILTEAVQHAPSTLGPWATLFHAFRASSALLVENRHFAEPRRRVIASSAPLQERELIKAMSLGARLAVALQERGVPDRVASLAVQVGMAAFSQAFSSWLDEETGDINDHLARAFREVYELSSQGLSSQG